MRDAQLRVCESPTQVKYTENTFGRYGRLASLLVNARVPGSRGIPQPNTRERTVRLSSYTDNSGRCTFTNLEDGEYVAIVKFDDIDLVKQVFNIPPGSPGGAIEIPIRY